MNKNEREKILNEFISKKDYVSAFNAIRILIDLANVEIIQNNIYSKNFYSAMEYYRNNNPELYELSQEIYDIFETFCDHTNPNDAEEMFLELNNLYKKLLNYKNKK